MIELDAAAQAWADGRREAAFEPLCRLWAETQEPALAELCEQISEALVRDRVAALEREHGRERVQGELILAARAGDRVAAHALAPWLLGLARPKGRQRLLMLEPPDPVALRWATSWIRRRSELNELLEYLHGINLSWVRRWLAWWVRDVPKGQAKDPFERFAWTMRRQPHPRRGRRLSPGEREAVDRVRAAFEAGLSPRDLAARRLYRAVAEQPDDDGPRAVLADFLLAADAGDPRGEFIGLQLRAAAGELPEPARARERELLDLHGLRWLGPLADACELASVEFERGFLSNVDLLEPLLVPAGHSAAPGDPIWATVERVNNPSFEVIDHPIMRSLRVLGCTHEVAAALLDGRPRPTIEALTVTWTSPRWTGEGAPPSVTPATAAALLDGELAALPKLRHLGVRDRVSPQPHAWRWLWTGPRASLESARLRLDAAPELAAWIEQLREDRSSVALALDHIELRYVLNLRSEQSVIRVTHNVPRWRSFNRGPMVEVLAATLALALERGGVGRVIVDPAVTDLDALRSGLRGAGVSSDSVEFTSAPT